MLFQTKWLTFLGKTSTCLIENNPCFLDTFFFKLNGWPFLGKTLTCFFMKIDLRFSINELFLETNVFLNKLIDFFLGKTSTYLLENNQCVFDKNIIFFQTKWLAFLRTSLTCFLGKISTCVFGKTYFFGKQSMFFRQMVGLFYEKHRCILGKNIVILIS